MKEKKFRQREEKNSGHALSKQLVVASTSTALSRPE